MGRSGTVLSGEGLTVSEFNVTFPTGPSLPQYWSCKAPTPILTLHPNHLVSFLKTCTSSPESLTAQVPFPEAPQVESHCLQPFPYAAFHLAPLIPAVTDVSQPPVARLWASWGRDACLVHCWIPSACTQLVLNKYLLSKLVKKQYGFSLQGLYNYWTERKTELNKQKKPQLWPSINCF